MIEACWAQCADVRPSFADICKELIPEASYEQHIVRGTTNSRTNESKNSVSESPSFVSIQSSRRETLCGTMDLATVPNPVESDRQPSEASDNIYVIKGILERVATDSLRKNKRGHDQIVLGEKKVHQTPSAKRFVIISKLFGYACVLHIYCYIYLHLVVFSRVADNHKWNSNAQHGQ